MAPIQTLLVIAVVLGAILGTCAYLSWLERKLAAWMQDRLGPNRVGKFGLLQPLADGLKFLFKEDVIPAHVDTRLYVLAPGISLFTTFLAFSVVPFGPADEYLGPLRFIIAPRLDIGVLFIFAATSLAVYGIILGGWASNNKYSMLGALRSTAQVVSYEIPLGLSVLGVIVLSNSLNLEQVVAQQAAHGWWAWNVWCQPLAGLIFFLSALAESNRLPFDLPECEQELIGGYHTEYSALKFAMFFLAEYTHVVTISFLVALLYFGGWHFPWIAEPGSAYTGAVVVKVLVLLAKVFLSILFVMVIRWTIPRYRYDQLMTLVWKGLIPLALLNLVCVMVVKEYGLHRAWLAGASLVLFLGAAVISAASMPRAAREGRRAVAETRARWAGAGGSFEVAHGGEK